MKKISLALSLCAALCSSVSAEESGAFVGLDLGFAQGKIAGTEYQGGSTYNSEFPSDNSAIRYGILGGYKHFLSESLGFRGYINLTNGSNFNFKTQGEQVGEVSSYSVGLNADVLLNLIKKKDAEIGVYTGLSLAYANNTTIDSISKEKDGISGFDAGINLGLRATLYSVHGIELWSRFNIKGPEKESTGSDYGGEWRQTVSITQPYAVGIRYVYNFKI